MAKNAPKTTAFGLTPDNLKRPPATPTPTHTHTQAEPTPERRQSSTKENKSKRIYPLVTPSMAARIHAAAADQGLSTNDLLNQIFEEYLDREGY